MPGINFSGPHLKMGNLTVFFVDFTVGQRFLMLSPIEMPGIKFRDFIWGWRISVFFGLLTIRQRFP
jgi:hypothetical protein